MRRSFVTLTCAVAVLAAPVALLAQDPPAQQQQQQQQQPPTDPTQQQQQPQQPQEPRITFTSDAGMLLFTIKGDQVARFEDLVARMRTALANSEDPVRKQQLQGLQIFKAAEPGPESNAVYVMLANPAVKGAEYDPVMLVVEALGEEYAKPENQEMVKSFVAVFANVNRLNLTPVAKY